MIWLCFQYLTSFANGMLARTLSSLSDVLTQARDIEIFMNMCVYLNEALISENVIYIVDIELMNQISTNLYTVSYVLGYVLHFNMLYAR